jgi:hypothetical protein
MDSVEKAQDELKVVAPPDPQPEPPKSLEEVISGLKGFGIEEFEEILTIKCKNRDLRVKIANIPTSDEMLSVQAADEFKGYLWTKRVKVELLSRAISWIEGIDLRGLPPERRFLPDITDKDKPLRDCQVVLRNVIMGWGQELVEVLWKVLMTHSQNIEDRLKEQFPDSATLTEVERRLFERARKQIDEANKAILEEQVSARYDTESEKENKE